MRGFDHVIWDWNGTLLDDAWLCVDVMNGMLCRRALPVLTPAKYEESFDFPVLDFYRRRELPGTRRGNGRDSPRASPVVLERHVADLPKGWLQERR